MVSIAFSMFSQESYSNLFFENIEASLLTTLNDEIYVTLRTLSPKINGEFSILIPIMEEQFISYTTIFKLLDDQINYSLSIIVESTSQDDLFKRIPIITDLISEFVNRIVIENLSIKALFYQSEFQILIHNVMETVDDLFLMDPLGYINPKNSAFMDLIMKLGKNAPMFFNSVLNNQKTVILANSQADDGLVRYPWKNLIPRKDLKIKFWPDTVNDQDDFDIIIIEKFQKKQCNPNWFILDLDAGTIENGMNDEILNHYFTYLTELNKGFGSILKISKLNPPLSCNNDVIVSNFVLSDEDSNEKEIYLVQTCVKQRSEEVLI